MSGAALPRCDCGEQPPTAMSICIDACAAQERVVVTTRTSIYEVVLGRHDRGDVLVRGGRFFSDFSPVVFLGSIADDGSLEPRTVNVGLRMKFQCGDRVVITSPAQSFSIHAVEPPPPGVA